MGCQRGRPPAPMHVALLIVGALCVPNDILMLDASLLMRQLLRLFGGAIVDIVSAQDIVLAEIGADLNFDQFEGDLAGVG